MTIGVNLPLRLAATLAQGLEKAKAICIVLKNRFPSIPTIHDVIDRAWILDSELPRHAATIAATLPLQSTGQFDC
jgi:hypothetical protein